MSSKAITAHPQDGQPLGRNTLPVSECSVQTKTVGGVQRKAIDVPVLSCASVWLRLQREAESWIAPGGKLIADPIARNRQINRAYAQLWLADRRFQWAGLAAFASKQVGCGLLHAAENIKKSQEEIALNAQRPHIMNSADSAAINLLPSAIAAGSAYMYRQLALGNTLLFLDIYPLHRFYMLRGFKAFQQCQHQRKQLAGQVIWPVSENKLPFGIIHKEALEGFRYIENGVLIDSVKSLALHEQVNILQAAMYNDVAMRRALQANQFSWATGFPNGVAAEIQLTLSAQCKTPRDTLSTWFSRDVNAKLYDSDQRMKFVYQAAQQFDSLLNKTATPEIEAALIEIASTNTP